MADALFISTAEAAELLGVPASTLRFWGWSDQVPPGFPPSVKIGRLRMYPAQAVRAWAELQIAEAGARDG